MIGIEDVDDINAILTVRRDAADADIMCTAIIINHPIFLSLTIIFFQPVSIPFPNEAAEHNIHQPLHQYKANKWK